MGGHKTRHVVCEGSLGLLPLAPSQHWKASGHVVANSGSLVQIAASILSDPTMVKRENLHPATWEPE